MMPRRQIINSTTVRIGRKSKKPMPVRKAMAKQEKNRKADKDDGNQAEAAAAK